jgi:hypothetical protein
MIAVFIMSTVKIGYAWEFIGNHLFKFYTGAGLSLLIDVHFIFFFGVGSSLFWEPISNEYQNHRYA